MRFQRSDQQRGSRYSAGGKAELKGIRLGYWEPKVFPKSDTDIPFPLTSQFHLRPDLLASTAYGKDNLMWFILQYNNILDVNTEFVEGAVIMLPTRKRLFSELLSSAL